MTCAFDSRLVSLRNSSLLGRIWAIIVPRSCARAHGLPALVLRCICPGVRALNLVGVQLNLQLNENESTKRILTCLREVRDRMHANSSEIDAIVVPCLVHKCLEVVLHAKISKT